MKRWTSNALAAALGGALALGPAAAAAQEVHEPVYLTVDAEVGAALNDPVEDQFETGGGGGVGLYWSLVPELAIGARVGAGALAEGDPVPQDPVPRGVGDYGLLAASVRVHPFASLMDTRSRAAGFYLAASPGVGVFDGEIVPGYSTSVGYNIALGPVSVGPKARFTHFIETEGRFGDNDVLMLTGGLEVAIHDQATVDEPPPPPETLAVVTEPAEEPEPAPAPPEPEEPREPRVEADLRLDQRAYFDYDAATIRPAVREELNQVADHYGRNQERLQHVVLRGHADDRGSAKYNERLSAARALAAARYLVSEGVPMEALHLEAHGESRPLEPDAETPRAHQLNRRVEFDVAWAEGQRPEGRMPEPSPNMPQTIDEAPSDAAPDHAPPPPGSSRAEQLFERERRELSELVDGRVTATLDESTREGGTIAVRVQQRE